MNLANTSTSTVANPGQIGPVTFNDIITITNGGQSISQTLSATFSGTNITQTSGDFSSSIQTSQPAALTFTFANGNIVTLSPFSFTAPGTPGGGVGAVGATANVTVVTTNAAPEPGTLALLGTGVLGMAGAVVRRRAK